MSDKNASKSECDSPRSMHRISYVIDRPNLKRILARMCAVDGVPFALFCTSQDLRRLFQASNHDLPKSANTVKQIVVQYAEEAKILVKGMLEAQKSIGGRFSVTLDEWTSLSNDRYLNVNVHSGSQVFNLGLKKVYGTFSATKCEDALRQVIAEYGLELDSDIVGVTSDGCAMMVKMGRDLNCITQLCYNHGLQLAVIDVLYKAKTRSEPSDDICEGDCNAEDDDDNGLADPVVQEIEDEECQVIEAASISYTISKVRNFVRKVRRSPKTIEKFIKYQEDAGVQPVTLILDCKTRWSSLSDMVERVLRTKDSVLKTQIDIGLQQQDRLNDNDFSIINDLVSSLKPIKAATEALSNREATLITAEASIKFLLEELNTDSHLCQQLRSRIEERIVQERYTEASRAIQHLHRPMERIMKKSAIKKFCHEQLHRMGFMENSDASESSINQSVKVIEHADIDKEQQSAFSMQAQVNSNTSLNAASDIQPQCQSIDVYKKLKMAINEASSPSKIVQTRDPNFHSLVSNELSAAECNGQVGFYLSRIYKCLMTIPPTSVESERAFSASGQLCTKFRSRLSPKTLSALTFLRSNFKRGIL